MEKKQEKTKFYQQRICIDGILRIRLETPRGVRGNTYMIDWFSEECRSSQSYRKYQITILYFLRKCFILKFRFNYSIPWQRSLHRRARSQQSNLLHSINNIIWSFFLPSYIFYYIVFNELFLFEYILIYHSKFFEILGRLSCTS